MMIKRIVPAMVFLLLNISSVYAQKKTYSLPQVWQKVLQYYPSITAKKEAIQLQEIQKKLTREGFLPDVEIQSQHSFGSVQNAPGAFFPLPGMYTITGNNKISEGTTLGANLYSSALLKWDILQFGLQQKKLKAADASIKVSNTLLKQEEYNLVIAATRLYFSVATISASLQVAKSDTRRLSELLELLQSQANAGLRPGADTLLLKASLLQSKTREHDFKATLLSRLTLLSALMGETSSEIALDTTIFNRFQQTPLGTNEAVQKHPYLQVMNARIQSAEADKEVIKKEIYPTISLMAGVGLKGSGIAADGSVNKGFSAPWKNAAGTYLAGVGITWNFASLYQNKSKRAVADRVIAVAKAEREVVEIQLQSQYSAALSGWEEQRQKLLVASASLKASKDAYGLYEVRYRSGLLSLIELLQLQKNLQEAESNYVAAVSAYWNELLNQAETLADPSLILTVIQP